MANILNKPIDFVINAGKGFMSFYEFLNLSKNQCFITNTKCGEMFTMKINDDIICKGETIVFDKSNFGFRIVDINTKSENIEIPFQTETMGKLIPFTIEYDSFKATIKDLINIVPGSLLLLDKKYNKEIDVTMKVFGFKIAEGKLILLYDNFGILIKNVLPDISEIKNSLIKENINVDILYSGNKYNYDEYRNVIKIFDFLNPIRYSWAKLKKIEIYHQPFINNSGLIFNKQIDDNLIIKSYQKIYNELLNKNINNFNIMLFNLNFKNQITYENKNIKYFFESNYIKAKFDEEFKNLLQNRDKNYINKKYPNVIVMISKKLLNNTGNIHSLIEYAFKNTWNNFSPVNIEFLKEAKNEKDLDIIPPYAICLILSINYGNEEALKIIYPHYSIDSFINFI